MRGPTGSGHRLRRSGAAPGRYFSVFVARKSQAPQHLAELSQMRFAYNMAHSQSGFAAPVRLLASGGHSSSPQPLETGAHRASIIAVATGAADWAAIDAVAWELARRHEPAADDLVVFARTPENRSQDGFVIRFRVYLPGAFRL